MNNVNPILGVLHPITGGDTGITLTINRERYNNKLKALYLHKFGESLRRGRPKCYEQDLLYWEKSAVAKACVEGVLDWDNVSIEEKTLECNECNKRLVFNRYIWLGKQVEEFVGVFK